MGPADARDPPLRDAAHRRFLTAASLALLALGVLAANAQAAPTISLTPGGDTEVLYGDTATVKLTATNSIGQPTGYNLSFRAVLPAGVSYVAGSGPAGVPATILANEPAAGQTTVIFQNVSDLSANSSYELSFQVDHNPAQLAVGSTFTVQGAAYLNTDARTVPQFNATTGAPDAATYTGTASASQAVTLLPFRVFREAPDDQLRGAHDFQYRTRIRIENNKVAPTQSISLTDYAPAGVEVLACGTGDHTTNAPTNSGSSSEHPGSGPLNPGNAPSLTNCVAPSDVSTVSADPDGPGGVAAGIYTRQTWSNLGTLAAGATLSLDFATAIPIRENTLSWTGATPGGASGNQAANLDNNSGAETYDEQALTGYSTATGQYNGTTSYSASDSQTTVAEDLALAKTASSSSIAIGATTTWTLTASASEYRWVDDAVIVDTVPDGLCPLGAANYENATDQQTECDPISGSDPYDTVVENADGTYTVTFDPLARIAPAGSRQVELTTRTRSHYQQSFVDATEVLANDSWTNAATVSGNDFVICTGGSGATDCAGGTKIDHDEADGQPDLDAASATQTADGPTLDKKVAVSGIDCDAATYSSSDQHYGPGDRICWKLRMDFPAGTPTGNVQVTDFLPLGHTYESGSFHTTASNNVPVGATDASQSGLLKWTLGNSGIAGQALVFEAVISTIVNQQVSPAFPGQLTQNLLKASTTNTPETSFPLRDDAGVVIDEAHTKLYGTAHLDDPLSSRQTLVPGSLTATRNGGALPAGASASEGANAIALTFPADYEPTADETYR
jgi:hypothetical protein